MKVASVTVNYKTADLTLRALEAVLVDLVPLSGTALVVDNDSRDGSAERLRRAIGERGWSERVTLLVSGENVGFGAGNNIAFRHALARRDPPDYFYLLNPDARPDPGALRALVEFMDSHPGVGLAGSKIRHPDGSPRISAFRFPGVLSEIEAGLRLGLVSKLLGPWRVWAPPPERTGPVDWVSGASVIIRRDVLEQVGLFDERFFLYFEEIDLGLRAKRAGWPTWYVVESEVEHIGQVSTGLRDIDRPRPEYWFESRRHFLRKSYGPLRLWAANTAFITSYVLFRLRRHLQNKPDPDPPGFFADFVRYNFSPLASMLTRRFEA